MSEIKEEEEDGPPLRLVIRSKAEGVEILEVGGREKKETNEIGNNFKRSILARAPLFPRLAVNGNNSDLGIEIINGLNGLKLAELPKETSVIERFEFSPQATYLITWQKADATNLPNGSLRIWNSENGKFLRSIHCKQIQTKSLQSILAWTGDEKICFHKVTNTIHIQRGDDGQQINSIRISDVSQISVCQGESCVAPYPLACLIPENKGKPAMISIFAATDKNNEELKCLASKSFYRAQDVSIEWSPMGHGVLIQAHTDVDATGTSYYGGTSLYLLVIDKNQTDCGSCSQIQLPKEGPIADAKWEPAKGEEFIIIAGTVPAIAAIYNLKGQLIYNFGAAHRNVISWSPHGRFLALCGFGNLAGDVDFWDRQKKKKINSINIPCAVTYGWSPDSRQFMTATLAPRMNVDNCIRLYRYDGTGPILHKTDRDPLYECFWLYASPSLYRDRGISPQAKLRLKERQNKQANQTTDVTPVAQAYVPPAARGRGSSLAAKIRAEREAQLGKNNNASRNGSKSNIAPLVKAIPGLAQPQSETSNKNKKKRQAAKKRKEAAAALETEEASPLPSSPTSINAIQQEEIPSSKDDLLKRQSFKKKIKQVSELQDKVAAGLKPSADQQDKLSRSDALHTELSDIETKLSQL